MGGVFRNRFRTWRGPQRSSAELKGPDLPMGRSIAAVVPQLTPLDFQGRVGRLGVDPYRGEIVRSYDRFWSSRHDETTPLVRILSNSASNSAKVATMLKNIFPIGSVGS